MSKVRVRTALASVSDKAGLVAMGQSLFTHDVHILSTGGTFRMLGDAGIDVQEVSAYTGFPEMMDGRVKTLHPRVHGGLLGRVGSDGEGQDAEVMREHGIRPIDVVIVNLYPFEETVAKPDVSLEDAIENIDIGGPAMLRSAAKNFARVTVVVDPADYEALASELKENDGYVSLDTRFRLAKKAFDHVARYDNAIAAYLNERARLA
jgi:phosphoribosylaminoimidazolecarboxamide formyltransferase/IMP cyclohydrolase